MQLHHQADYDLKYPHSETDYTTLYMQLMHRHATKETALKLPTCDILLNDPSVYTALDQWTTQYLNYT